MALETYCFVCPDVTGIHRIGALEHRSHDRLSTFKYLPNMGGPALPTTQLDNMIKLPFRRLWSVYGNSLYHSCARG